MQLWKWIHSKAEDSKPESVESSTPQEGQATVVELSPNEIAALSMFTDPECNEKYALSRFGVDVKRSRVAATDSRKMLVIDAPEPNADRRTYHIPIPVHDVETHGRFPDVQEVLSQSPQKFLRLDLGFLEEIVAALKLVAKADYSTERFYVDVSIDPDRKSPLFFRVPTPRGTATAVVMPVFSNEVES